MTAALPSIKPLSTAAPVPLPAALDTSKVAALIARAPAPAAPSAPSAAPVEAPLMVLEAVNSTLRDFTPGQIREMPEEKLQALASVILDAEGVVFRHYTTKEGLDSILLSLSGLGKVDDEAAPAARPVLHPDIPLVRRHGRAAAPERAHSTSMTPPPVEAFKALAIRSARIR